MEMAVIVAVACIAIELLGVVVALVIAYTSTGDIPLILLIHLPIGGLLIPGILRGSRFAWDCGKSACIALFIFVYGSLFRMSDWWTVDAMMLASYGLLGSLLFFSLDSDGARRHFGLICPQCGGKSYKAKDLLSRRMQCRDCDTLF